MVFINDRIIPGLVSINANVEKVRIAQKKQMTSNTSSWFISNA